MAKVTFEFDMLEDRDMLIPHQRLEEALDALLEIHRLSRNVNKHGDDDHKLLSSTMEEIQGISAIVLDILD